MRKTIKRLLKKYDYPSEQSMHALEVVMRRAELMCGYMDMDEIINSDRVAEDGGDY